MTLIQAFGKELRKPVVPMSREKLKRTDSARARLPMRDTGAEPLVGGTKAL